MNVTKINQAINITHKVIEEFIIKLETKFLKVESNKLDNFYSLKCYLTNSTYLELRILEDTDRTKIKLPSSVKEYYSKGGSEKLMEDFNYYSKDAWKCEIKEHLENNKIMEYGIGVNEKNFDEKKLESLIDKYFLEK